VSDAISPSDGAVSEPAQQDELVRRIIALGMGAMLYERKASCSAVQISSDKLIPLMTQLHDDTDFAFAMLVSHTVVDRIEQNEFELLYFLYSLIHRKQLLVSVSIPRDNPVVPTLSSVWKIAEFQEREAYDLFGIQYDNHPDLRRVFLEDDWKGFPLRKDYKDDFMLTHVIEEEA
jgi:NADH-quinone oxidoreductase subunit C